MYRMPENEREKKTHRWIQFKLIASDRYIDSRLL